MDECFLFPEGAESTDVIGGMRRRPLGLLGQSGTPDNYKRKVRKARTLLAGCGVARGFLVSRGRMTTTIWLAIAIPILKPDRGWGRLGFTKLELRAPMGDVALEGFLVSRGRLIPTIWGLRAKQSKFIELQHLQLRPVFHILYASERRCRLGW